MIKSAISRQIKQLEIGDAEPPEENLLVRAVVKLALSDASREKVDKHLFAEHPSFRPWFDCLRGGKSQYNPESLVNVWKVDHEMAMGRAHELEEIGFWLKEKPDSPEFWIPFIFRDGLDITQGQAD